MSYSDFKEVNINNPGTGTKYGSDQVLEICQIFNNKIVSSRQVRIKNPWQFTDHIELVQPVSLPAAPGANTRYLVVDPADSHLKIVKTGGTLVDLEALAAQGWSPSASETLTNKTLSTNLNTLKHSTTNTLGELLVNTGTKFDRKAKGSALQLLRTNSGATDIEWVDPSVVSGGGETNTMTNIGTGTVGIYKQKTGVQFELKTIRAASSGMSIVDDVANNRIDFDVNLAGITLQTLAGAVVLTSQVSGILPVANGGTGASSLTGLVKGAGTANLTAIANGAAGQVLTMSGGNPTWVTPQTGGSLFYPDQTQWGGFWGGATEGVGVFAGSSVYGAAITGDQTSASDSFTTFTTDNTDAAIAGWRTLVTVTRRDRNPILNFRFKLSDPPNSHPWIGFCSEASIPTDTSADDPLDGVSGILVGFTDVHNNFQVTYNAGGAGGAFIDTGTAKNTSVHDVQIEFDNVAGKPKVTWDGSIKTPAGSADCPATTTPLFVHFNEETMNANATAISLAYAKLVANS